MRTLLITVMLMGTAVALEAGVGVADITPDLDQHVVPLAGYGARLGKPSTGVHDKLQAKVLYLRDGARTAALITCDLRSMTPEFKGQVIEKSAHLGFTADNVLICSSHTHAGPSFFSEAFWQMQFGKHDPAIVDIMTTNVAKALEAAVKSAQGVKVGFGQTRAEKFTRNRRWGYDTAAREAAGEQRALDPVLSVLRFDDATDTPIALLVHYATHPTIAGHENMEVSAEWPGVLQRELETAFPEAVALYANGALGDQAPAGAQGEDDFARIEDFGSRLASVAADMARGIQTTPGSAVRSARTTPELPERSFTENAKRRYGEYLETALAGIPTHAEVQALRIGPIALVGLPGEPIVEVGQATQTAAAAHGFEHVLVLGLANDYIGYIVNGKEYAHGGYEVDARSYYGPGLGHFMAQAAGRTAALLLDKE
jgi:neutral/alkaline ceramidase-like enzyme